LPRPPLSAGIDTTDGLPVMCLSVFFILFTTLNHVKKNKVIRSRLHILKTPAAVATDKKSFKLAIRKKMSDRGRNLIIAMA